jgi:hypothetical protein
MRLPLRLRSASPTPLWQVPPASPPSVSVTDAAVAGPTGLPPSAVTDARWRPTASPPSVSVTDAAVAGRSPARLPLRLRSASPTEHRQVQRALVAPNARCACLSALGQRHRPSTGRSNGLLPPQTPDAPASPPSVSVTDGAQAGRSPARLPLRPRSASPTEHRQVQRALVAPNARCACLSSGRGATQLLGTAHPTALSRARVVGDSAAWDCASDSAQSHFARRDADVSVNDVPGLKRRRSPRFEAATISPV